MQTNKKEAKQVEKEFNKKLYNILGYKPFNKKLYLSAFTHKSFPVSNTEDNNERLEFIGDSVLSTIISDILYRKFPNGNEGMLTEMRSKIVNRRSLDRIGYKMGLQECLRASEKSSKNNRNSHILGNVLEALIGAIYVDKNYKTTYKFVLKHIIEPYVNIEDLVNMVYSYKNLLLNWAAKNKTFITFTDKKVSGPNRTDWFEVSITDEEGLLLASAVAKSKKEASQLASEMAIDFLREDGRYTEES